MKKYGYIRVSTKEQNPDRQLAALQEFDIPKENIYLDQMSGKDFRRPQYQRLTKALRKGDLLIIKSIDRLGRNYGEILEQWRTITKETGADIRVIDMPLLNTDTVQGDLTGVFISDLVLQILAYVAETERAFIRQRQAEGIAAAKARGIKFGRPSRTLPENFDKVYQRWREQEISVAEAAAECGMPRSTFHDKAQKYKNDNVK